MAPSATADLPQAVPADPMPPTAPSPTYPINIAPTGTTHTGCQVRTPSRFGYAAYLAKTALSGIAVLHPLACLQMVSGDINQPEGYPDAMPLDVALAQPDRDNFIGVMEKELKQHSELKHWCIVHRSQVPRNAKPIPMVWTLHRKRDLAGAIVKWKARLCAGGHRQVYGDTYWSTFAPVMSWTTVRCIFVLALLLGWHMRSIDFIMAYTQAKVKTDIYMTLPRATTIQNIDPSKHLLKLQQNLYSLKDGQVTWHEHIKKGLKERGFTPSKVDPCLFIKGSVLLVLYTDDAAFFSPSAQAIDDEITSLKKAFDLTDEGELQDYLGTRFIRHTDGRMELQQQKSIDNCLRLMGMGEDKENVKIHDTPAESSKILHADDNGTDRKQGWNFRAVVGCLNYLQAMTRPDLSYSVHQCTRFCNSPKLSHEQALKRICRYLCGT